MSVCSSNLQFQRVFGVKIFAVDVEKAVTKLNNRFFAGRRIQAQIYDMELYKNNDLSS